MPHQAWSPLPAPVSPAFLRRWKMLLLHTHTQSQGSRGRGWGDEQPDRHWTSSARTHCHLQKATTHTLTHTEQTHSHTHSHTRTPGTDIHSSTSCACVCVCHDICMWILVLDPSSTRPTLLLPPLLPHSPPLAHNSSINFHVLGPQLPSPLPALATPPLRP